MNEDARRVYGGFASIFLVTGLVFVVLGVLRATLLPDVLRGNPLPVALLLLAIGGGLRWTVRRRADEDPEPLAVARDDVEDSSDADASDADASYAEGPRGRRPDAEG